MLRILIKFKSVLPFNPLPTMSFFTVKSTVLNVLITTQLIELNVLLYNHKCHNLKSSNRFHTDLPAILRTN